MASHDETDELLPSKLESSAEMSSRVASNVFSEVESSHETIETSAVHSKERSNSTGFIPVEVRTRDIIYPYLSSLYAYPS